MDTEARLADIRTRITQASQEEARNDILRERSLKEKEDALALLRSEFGVSSVAKAEALLKDLEKKREKLLSELEDKLDELGA